MCGEANNIKLKSELKFLLFSFGIATWENFDENRHYHFHMHHFSIADKYRNSAQT